MASSFANSLLLASFFFSIFFNIFFFKKKYSLGFVSYILASFILIVSFFVLLFFFYTSNFSILAVYENSHSLKPIFYKIAGTWGNHEGSMLLFISIIAVYGVCFIRITKIEDVFFKSLIIFFQNNLQIIFLLYLILFSNPFDEVIPAPKEGLGLNPILQDPLLLIHPPFLYLGYIGFSLTLSLVLAGLLSHNFNSSWVMIAKKWILIAWTFLTIGISLGSIWAYYELGWGGFWFWDPVENASLMPWLASTALIHCLFVMEKKEQFKSWTALLAILTFSLSLLGTFLVRSGILNSVHAFANDPSRGLFILLIILIITFISIVIFILKTQSNSKKQKLIILSKEGFLLFNNLFLMFFLSIVVVGTVYPIILSALFNKSVSVGPQYYNALIAPFLFIFIILMAIGPLLTWLENNFFNLKKRIIFTVLFTFIITFFIILLVKKTNLFLIIGIFTSLFLLLNTLIDAIKKNYFFNKFYQPRIFSHLGFGLLVLSIFLNSFLSTEMEFEIQPGKKIIKNGVSFEILNTYETKQKNYIELISKFEVIKNNYSFNLTPSVRKYLQPEQLTSETSIKSEFFSDHYIVMNYPKGNLKSFEARYHYNFFIHGIWFSLFLIALGGALSVFYKK